MPITLTPFSASFGAQVDGLDLREPIAADDFEAIEQALATWSLLCFRDQRIDDAQQLAFSGRFGRIHSSIMAATRKRLKDQRFGDVSNLGHDGEIMAADADRRRFIEANQLWHTDLSFMAAPARVTVLSARRLPPDPPNTEYADMRAAWDALPDTMKRRIADLRCEHSIFASRERAGFTSFTQAERDAAPPAIQPLVRTHRRSGRNALYLSSHASRILDMPIDEGRALLAELTEFATQPRFVFAHRWQAHDLVCWDDSCTMHRARPYDSLNLVRELRWNAVVEDKPLAAALA